MSPLDLDALANSRFGLKVATGIGRATPPSVGHRLADQAADALARRRGSAIVRAVRANRWVASGGTLTGAALDEAVRLTLRHIGRCIYDLYHLTDDAATLARRVRISPEFAERLERLDGGEAVVVGAPHMSNFDFAGRALARAGFRAQVLSVPDPTDAYRAQNEARQRVGLEITPISPEALRLALKRLEGGGAVLTGVDRPLEDGGRELTFFGRPARLPDVHVRLASRVGVPFVLVWVTMAEDGAYDVWAEEVALSGGRGDEAVRRDAEKVLARAERVIAERPEQWAMPHPVWPEALEELDALERRMGAPEGRA
ncbi:MAG: lysophospholipid acyltransferase family protein [Coriobacteriia bacterium]|nr:lysophospholipid acyltransferase family protein [Coriobacteriia bacterium]